MNEITKKDSIKTILIAILSILLVGCVGFIAYDKLIKKEEPITEENNKQEDNKVEENNKVEDNKQEISGTYFNITELYGESREILITLKNDNTFYIKNEEFDYDLEMKGEYNLINNKLELTNIKPTGSTLEFSVDSIFHESREKFEFDENGNIKKIVLEVKDNTLFFNELSFKK